MSDYSKVVTLDAKSMTDDDIVKVIEGCQTWHYSDDLSTILCMDKMDGKLDPYGVDHYTPKKRIINVTQKTRNRLLETKTTWPKQTAFGEDLVYDVTVALDGNNDEAAARAIDRSVRNDPKLRDLFDGDSSGSDFPVVSSDSLMKNSYFYSSFTALDKELIEKFPQLKPQQGLTWMQMGATLGALLIISDPAAIGTKRLMRHLAGSTFGRAILKWAGMKFTASGVVKTAVVDGAAQVTLESAFKRNFKYILMGLISDASALSDFEGVSNQNTPPPKVVIDNAQKDIPYIMAIFHPEAYKRVKLYKEPGEGFAITITYNQILKAIWMTKSYMNYLAGQERIADYSDVSAYHYVLCGLADHGFADSHIDQLNITTFNSDDTSNWGGLNLDAYCAFRRIQELALRFDRVLSQSPWEETRNSMLVTYVSAVMHKTGYRKLKLVFTPVAKTFDYLDLTPVLGE